MPVHGEFPRSHTVAVKLGMPQDGTDLTINFRLFTGKVLTFLITHVILYHNTQIEMPVLSTSPGE